MCKRDDNTLPVLLQARQQCQQWIFDKLFWRDGIRGPWFIGLVPLYVVGIVQQ